MSSRANSFLSNIFVCSVNILVNCVADVCYYENAVGNSSRKAIVISNALNYTFSGVLARCVRVFCLYKKYVSVLIFRRSYGPCSDETWRYHQPNLAPLSCRTTDKGE
jgi:hypothetical protein